MKDEQLITAPVTMDSVVKLRSAPDVPTDPVPTVAEPEVTSAKYPAVPVFPAIPDVMALAAADPPLPEAVAPANAVAPNVIVASSVPVRDPSTDGWEPVYTWIVPRFSRAVKALIIVSHGESYMSGLLANSLSLLLCNGLLPGHGSD